MEFAMSITIKCNVIDSLIANNKVNPNKISTKSNQLFLNKNKNI